MTHFDCNLEPINTAVAGIINSVSDNTRDDLRHFEAGRAKRAVLLYRAAAGEAADETLFSAAVALELLELGLAKHFAAAEPVYGTPAANLALITADRYYAKALALVVALGDDRLVKILCAALARASEGYGRPQQPGAGLRQDALAEAAFQLGCLLANRHDSQDSPSQTLIEEVNSALFPNPS